MAKKKVANLLGVIASVFAHTGAISKEDAREISGLPEGNFENAYDKAAEVAEKVMNAEGDKMEKLIEQLAEVINDESADLGGIFK